MEVVQSGEKLLKNMVFNNWLELVGTTSIMERIMYPELRTARTSGGPADSFTLVAQPGVSPGNLEECELQHAAEFGATIGIKMDQVQQVLGTVHPKIHRQGPAGTTHLEKVGKVMEDC